MMMRIGKGRTSYLRKHLYITYPSGIKQHVQAYVCSPMSPRSLVVGKMRHVSSRTNSGDDLHFLRSKQNGREESWVIGCSAACARGRLARLCCRQKMVARPGVARKE